MRFHVLEGEGLIRAHCGLVVVRDREALRRHAGETYGYSEAEYSLLIAPFPRGILVQTTHSRRIVARCSRTVFEMAAWPRRRSLSTRRE